MKRIALERIEVLFDLAKKEFGRGREDLANRYIEIARKLSMKVNLSIPKKYKRQFCKKCYSFLVPGKNLKVRMNKGRIIYTCGVCKTVMRFPKGG
jgi:ribonuclease P protein subunit RPR2